MKWILFLATAMNTPDGIELARFESQEACWRAERIIWFMGEAAAKERGEQAPDLYGTCRIETPSAP